MARFTARNASRSMVPVAPARIWEIVTDADLLAKLTPLVTRIDVLGEHWRWHLAGFEGLGVSVTPVFTERMTFDPQRAIRFTHDPPRGHKERSGAEGSYVLEAVDGGTQLQVDLELCVELPLPRLTAFAVERVMTSTMRSTGKRFAVNLYKHLGLDPDQVQITEL